MPWRVSYELQVEGLIEGPSEGVQACVTEFKRWFPEGGPSEEAVWSRQFVLGGYQHCGWTSNDTRESSGTALMFHAEVKGVFPLDQPPDPKHLDWFYRYRGQGWYGDLNAAMRKVESVANTNSVRLVRPLAVRAWRWYCGNGGP